jgi:sec-independent protein translocase protein TatB
MFDFGFSEILLIFVLALIVLGPEKLPRVAAQVGRWIGRARGMARQFREQLEEEINLEEARKTQLPMTRTPAPEVTPQPIPPMTQVQPSAAAPVPQPEPEQPVTYPDHYSHAHPTDHLGRPIANSEIANPATPPAETAASQGTPPEVAPPDPRQQDWIGGVTPTDNPASNATDAAYAPPHGRGT